jgi:predicted phage terminase large subunit-like protein
MSFSRYMRDMMAADEFQALFPDARLDPNSRSVENWNMTNGGGYLAAGSGSGISGRGANVLVIDDIVKDIEAADSATIRDNTWEWYISTAYTRLAPGGGVLGLLTWWNEDDWAGRIQSAMATGEGDWFEVVRYPAINELGDEYLLPDDTIVEIPEGAPVPPGAKRTRPKGTAIHPERYSTEAMLRIKRNALAAGMKRTWDALYQQNPIPDTGNFFTPEMIRHYGSAPDRRGMRVYQAWDFAISEGKGSDYNAGVTIGVDGRDNVHVLDLLRFKISDGNLLIETVVDYARRWQPDVLGVEDGQIWKALESQFEKVCRETRYYPSFEVLKPLTDKMVRASPLRGRMQAGRVYFPSDAGFWPEMKKELLHFPAGKNDDIVDSLSWAVRLTLSRAPPREAAPPDPKSWKDKLWMVMKGVVHRFGAHGGVRGMKSLPGIR